MHYISILAGVNCFPTELQGFRQECLNGGSKWGGESGGPTTGEKIQSFKFQCLTWPILTEMTPKYGIYIFFLYQQGGDS